jgi:hypothetical protein
MSEVADLRSLGERDWEEPASVLAQMSPHEYPVIKYNGEILFIIAATKEYVIAVRFCFWSLRPPVVAGSVCDCSRRCHGVSNTYCRGIEFVYRAKERAV